MASFELRSVRFLNTCSRIFAVRSSEAPRPRDNTSLRLALIVVVSAVYGASTIGCASHQPFRLENVLSRKSKSSAADKRLANALQAINPAKGNSSASSGGYALDTSKRANETIQKAARLRGEPESFGTKLKATASYVGGALLVEPQQGASVSNQDPTSLSQNPGPIGPDVFIKSAALFEAQGDIVRAHEQYQQALAVDPQSTGALIGLGRLFHRHGQMTESIQTYQRALAAHPQDAVILNDIALCYARVQDYDKAISSMQTALQVRPDSVLYRNNLAAVFVEAGRPNKAVTTLAEVHGDAVANYNVGYLLNQRGMAADAHDYFVRALAIDPSMDQARTMLAKTAPTDRQQPVVGGPRRVPSTEAPNEQKYFQAQRPQQNDVGTLAPIVSQQQLAEMSLPVSEENQSAPFNYQLAAKSFTRMTDAFPVAQQPVPQTENLERAPTVAQLIPSAVQSDDPMQQVLESTKRLDESSFDDHNVAPASYAIPVESTPRSISSNHPNVLRMPKLSRPRAGDLVPPMPIGI